MRMRRHMAVAAALLGCVAGCGEAPEPVVMAAEWTPAPTPPPEQPAIDYPDLERGRYYSVSANTAIHAALPGTSDTPPRVENLPPRGVFQVIDRRPTGDVLWYRVLVSNGLDDYAMYLDAADLNGQEVALYDPPAVSPVPPPVAPEPARPVSMPRVRLY